MIKKAAIFLDRDGVITVEKSYVRRACDMEIFEYSKECVEQIHSLGYLAIIITNQSGVGRGYFSEEELLFMNERLIAETGVDAVYYCPHWYHEASTLPQYNVDCDCRKPKTGMIQQAVSAFREKEIELNLKDSYFVGDRGTDIRTGINAGMHTVLVESGYGSDTLEGVIPDEIYENLSDFVTHLMPAV